MQTAFPHLFEPLQIRGKRLKNRIMSTGHDTCLPTDNLVNDKLIAYQRDRAAGGVVDRGGRQRGAHRCPGPRRGAGRRRNLG